MEASSSQVGPSQGATWGHAALYARDQAPRHLELAEVASLDLPEDQLVWVHLVEPERHTAGTLISQLGWSARTLDFLLDLDSPPQLATLERCFGVRVNAILDEAGSARRTGPLTVICGPNTIVTAACHALPCVDDLYTRLEQNIEVGTMTAESFMVSLLDGHLASYFEAMSRLEGEIEKMEEDILARKPKDCLGQLRRLRQEASTLRKHLASHRVVFSGLARPDFQPNQAEQVNQHYAALDARYDRAIDTVEHARDLVVGSFELFTTRAAMATNETMQVLTFATVLLGILAVFTGLMGMNFEAPFFSSGSKGFWAVVAAMGAVTVVAVILGRWRGWLGSGPTK